jgi:hypothetical protein
MSRVTLIILLIMLTSMTGCVKNLSKQEKFLAAAPRSILVVPVVNNSVEVSATDYLLSTITIPLAERGYYVFPINMVKRVLEDDGLSDSSLVHSASTTKLANLFGADAVMYITIQEWDAKYMVLTTQVTVTLDYKIRDAKTNEVIWEHKEKVVYTPNSSGGGIGGLIAQAVVAAATKASPNYMSLARQANGHALSVYPGNGLPLGPYATEQR